MKTYLVGGAVRDMVMGVTPKDRDYVVVGATPQQMLDLGFSKVGADFPVFLHPSTGEEYALARTERKNGKGYHGFDTNCDPTVTLLEDLARRDLTINSMALDMDTNELIDPYNGSADIDRKILRHTSEAFADDPIRVLRLARFAARYEFWVDQYTVRLVRDMVADDVLNELTPERVWTEIERGIMEPYAPMMFDVLYETRANQTPYIRPFCPIVRDFSFEALYHEKATTLELRVALMCNELICNNKSDIIRGVPLNVLKPAIAVVKNIGALNGYWAMPPEQKYKFLCNIGAMGANRHSNIFEVFCNVVSIVNDIYLLSHQVYVSPSQIDRVLTHKKTIEQLDVKSIVDAGINVATNIKSAILKILED